MRISDWSSDVCSSDLNTPVTSGRREQRDVHAQYQQALLRYGRQVGLEERELVLAETAGVCRLHAGPVDHVVEQHERRERFFPGEGVGTEMSTEGLQRIRIVLRIGVHVVVEIGIASWRERVCQYV